MIAFSAADFISAVTARVVLVNKVHPPYHSNAHAHGVLLEEIDEFWSEVKRKRRDRDQKRIADELIDIGCCCYRWAEFCRSEAWILPWLQKQLVSTPEISSLHEAYSMMVQAERRICTECTPDRVPASIFLVAAQAYCQVIWRLNLQIKRKGSKG